MRRVAVITGASRRIVRATGLVLAGRRPDSRQDQGDDQTVWWLARQVVARQRGRLRIETPENSPTRHEEVDSPIRSKVMDADRDSSAPRPEISAHVGSCVIRVRELDPSLKFYCDVFSCNVAVREADMALLVAPNVFHIHLRAPSRRGRGHHRRVQYLLWATDTESDLQEFAPAAARLRACGLLPHRKRSDRHPRIRPRRGAGPRRLPESLSAPTHRDSSAPACLTVRPEQVASTGSSLPPTPAA